MVPIVALKGRVDMQNKSLFRILTIGLLVTLILGSGIIPTGAAPASQISGMMLPIYTMSAPVVSSDTVFGLSQTFDKITPSSVGPQVMEYKGFDLQLMADDLGEVLVEQYAATGGFYAFKPNLAFSDTPFGELGWAKAKSAACYYLYDLGFISLDGKLLVGHGTNSKLQQTIVSTQPFDDCSIPPNSFTVSSIMKTEEDAVTGVRTTITTGYLVQVAMRVQIDNNIIPLGGPGGHISLLHHETLFDSLSSDASGLGAVAMPFYGRETAPLMRDGQEVTLPLLDSKAVKSEMLASITRTFPNADSITIPDPILEYYITDASTPQSIMEPTYTFKGITVIQDGQEIALRDVTQPAVAGGPGGLGPTVAITSPSGGSSFVPFSPVTLTGLIEDGVAPYQYEWIVGDGSVKDSGQLDSAGEVTLVNADWPISGRGGVSGIVEVTLRVTDAEGVQRSASLGILPTGFQFIFLPLVSNLTQMFGMNELPSAELDAELQAYPYRFGVHGNSDYKPYGEGGSDLPAVVGDVNGFGKIMSAVGWPKKFDWRNANAWELDWRDCSLGGIDCTEGFDTVDFGYYAGHGGPGGLDITDTVEDSWVAGEKTRFSYLRWAAFSSCKTLRATPNDTSAPIRKWFNAFQGAHLLLGFHSNMSDIEFGAPFATRMILGRLVPFMPSMTIKDAWLATVFAMNAGKPAYIYAVGTNGVRGDSNYLPRVNDPALPRPYPVAGYAWVWWNE